MKYKWLIAILPVSFAVQAQTVDSLSLRRFQFNLEKKQKELTLPILYNTHLNPRKLLLPAATLIYGFMSLRNESLQEVNKEIQEEIREHNDQFHTSFDDYLQYTPAASVYLLNVSGVKGRHNFKDRSIILFTSVVLTTGTVFALKRITHQLRPDNRGYSSFPSGHTATAFSGAEFMQQEYKDHSPFLRFSGYAMAAGTGVLRMYNNRHWLADVITGVGIGILSTKASYWLFEKVKKKNSGSLPIL